jgi:hypothetical protein
MRENPKRYGLPMDFFIKRDAEGVQTPPPAVKIEDEDYENYRDPAAKSARELFEFAALWAIIGSCAFATFHLVAWLLGRIAPLEQLGLLGVVLPPLIGLAAPIAILNVGGEAGSRYARRLGSRYAFPLTLVAGVIIGWLCREHIPS